MARETTPVPGEGAGGESPLLRARRERMTGVRPRRRGGPLVAVLLGIGFLMLAVLVVFPEQARQFFGLGASESEEMQRTSRVDDSGISTVVIPRAEPEIEIETPTPRVRVVPPPARPEGISEEAKARIAALEAALKRLADRPVGQPGPTSAEIKALLDGQAAVLREEADARERLLQAELDALRAANAAAAGSPGPDASDLAEAERVRLEAEERRRLRAELERRQAERRAELERRRAAREAELAERRESDANVYDEGTEGTPSPGGTDAQEGVSEAAARTGSRRRLSDDEAFLRDAGRSSHKTVRATRLRDPARMIVQGTLISAVLETAIDSALPGNIRAQVTRPVYSFDGSRVLMPSGTRLIGTYNPKVALAQKRVLIAWNRAITPGGRSVALAATGTDTLGRAGQAGNVDTRFRERFGSAALISTIRAIPAALGGRSENGSGGAEAVLGAGEDVSDDLGDATEDALEEYLKLPPVIRVPKGTRMRVLVNRDLDFT